MLSFLSVFENELQMSSELELVETLSPESQAIVVGPGAEAREGIYNLDGKPSARLWVIRVESKDRAAEIAARIAGELDTWIEVRECFSGAQRP